MNPKIAIDMHNIKPLKTNPAFSIDSEQLSFFVQFERWNVIISEIF